MKVQGPSSTQASQNARRVGGAVAPGFVLPGGEVDTPSSLARATPLTNLTNIGALLALQSEDDVTERRRRATRRSNTLLDQLDGIRVSILSGGVTHQQVHALRTILSEQRAQVDDPELNSLLDDIELRAEVELAKLQKAM